MEKEVEETHKSVRIFVGGLGESVSNEDLRTLFASLGAVQTLQTIRTKGRSFAFRDFLSDRKSLSKLFSKFNGCLWKGGRLRLEKAKEDYLTRLKREWEQQEALLDAAQSSPVVLREMPTTNTANTHKSNTKHLNIYFPRLRKVKSIPFCGTGKHKCSFKNIKVPPLPVNFCDCEEHYSPFVTEREKLSIEGAVESGGMNDEEISMMNAVMNKLLGKEKISNATNLRKKESFESPDALHSDEYEDSETDEVDLIINVETKKNKKTLLRNQECGFNLESFYASLIDNSTHKRHLDQIHNQLVVSGLQHNGFLITKLVNGSSNLGQICYARKLFDEFCYRDIFLWNAIIRSYSRNNMFRDSVEMYRLMRWTGVHPDGFTFPYVLKACTELLDFGLSCLIHGQIIRYGFESDVFVQNGLVALYAKCGQVGMAKVVFDGLYNRTVVSWTSIISGYAQNGEVMEALRMFGKMRNADIKPDWIALVSILRAYTDVDDLEQGRSLHGCVIKMGLEDEPDLLISLIVFYAKCGLVTVARSFFDQMKSPNVIIWNAMISGYAKNGHAEDAVHLFRDMISRNIKPDSVTVRSAVLACAQVGSLKLAQWMDDYVSKSIYGSDIFVNTSLIDMYAKCGSLESARMVFDHNFDKDVVMWSAMIMGYGLHGQGREAIKLYHAMEKAHVLPNDVTFIGLLTACNHSGLVKEGWELFHCMKDFEIEPRNEHYSCVVDLLGRAGYLGQACAFMMKMPIEPGVSVWGALLSACKIHRCVTLGEYAANKLFSLDPYNTGHYVQLSNLYASSRLWDRVAHVRVLMKDKGLNKDLGYSVIEINGKLHTFQVGDKSHLMAKEIFNELQRLDRWLKEVGFVPHIESVLHDLNYEEKEENLSFHSERIAVAYGLISTAPGTTLRITKNLRACLNCHSAIKLISKLVEREIIVRDANRFHHFTDGVCSCGDYW